MPRWLRWVFGIVLVLVVIVGAGYWWFLVEGSLPADLSPKTIDIARVRSMADELAGPKATEVRVETVASMSFPTTAVIAGEGWEGLPMGVFSYQLVFPDQTIVIDTALDEKGRSGLGATFHSDAYAAMEAAMASATQILITHEHPDHLGGVLAYADPDLLRDRLRLTREQVASAGRYAGFTAPPGVIAEVKPLEYDDYLTVAPGVVLIKAPGHSPGSQMIYVRLANGTELLFTGDIGWSLRNIEEMRGRARLVSQFMLGEDRDAVFAELAGLRDLHIAEPGIALVPGHDVAVIDTLLADGTMVEGFVAPINP